MRGDLHARPLVNTTFLGVFLIFVLPWLVAGILSAAGSSSDTAGYAAALSPVFGAGGALVLFASQFGANSVRDLELGHLILSLAVASVLAVVFLLRCARARAEMSD